MTNEDKSRRMEVLKSVEKSWHQSKKFLAFIITESALVTMAILALKWQENLGWPLAAFMVTIVLVMGFISVAFNTKQATQDTFLRLAAIIGKVPTKLKKEMGEVAEDE